MDLHLELDDAASDCEDDEPRAFLRSFGNRHATTVLQRELHAERLSRKAAEAELAESQSSFARLKAFALEAVQQRDHAMSLKREAESAQQDLLRQLNDALQFRDEAIRQKDEALKIKDDAIRSRDEVCLLKDVAMHARNSSRLDNENSTRLFVAATDNLAAKVSPFRRFSEGLPRCSSHTGMAAITHGFITRTEEVVDELLGQLDLASKDKTALRDQYEQQHFEFTGRVSELESSIQTLTEQRLAQDEELGEWRVKSEKTEKKFSELEQMVSEKISMAEKEKLSLNNALDSKNSFLQNAGIQIKSLSRLLSQTYETIANYAVSYFSPDSLDRCIPISHHDEELEGSMNSCIAMVEKMSQLFLRLSMTWNEQKDLKSKALEDLEITVTRLIVEKNEITRFLESALATKQEILEAVSRVSLENDGNINTFAKVKEELLIADQGSTDNLLITGKLRNKVSVLETELKKSRQEAFELQQALAASCGELESLKVISERQTRKSLDKAVKLQDLQTEQHQMQKTIEDLKSELAAVGKSLLESKRTLRKESEARLLLLEESELLKEQVSFSKQLADRLSKSLDENARKLCLKEEMASAAVAARNAAELSLRMADERAVQLRKKIDTMVKQFELFERGEDGITNVSWYNSCWPCYWLGGNQSYSRDKSTRQAGAEMDMLLDSFV